MIDLHLHLDGSMTPEEILFLAKEQHIFLPAEQADDVRAMVSAPTDCRDLNEYLRCFELPVQVLQSAEALSYAVENLILRLAGQGILYAEIRFAPQFHTTKGLTQHDVVSAAEKGVQNGMRKCGRSISVKLILCCMRGGGNHKMNMETIRVAERKLGGIVCAVDLAGAEALYKTEEYKDIFAEAAKRGIPYTIHAGEASGPESVWAALSFGAKRIGHGVRSVEDERLMRTLADEGAVLELCPTSNLQTKAVRSITAYPIHAFLRYGVRVTVNTDNMTVSSTTIAKEFELLGKSVGITREQQKAMLETAAQAAFLSSAERGGLRKKLNGRNA